MNVYHIAYAPDVKQAYLHFWGCNMKCRACLCLKEILDCHLEETRERIFRKDGQAGTPQKFLDIKDVLKLLSEVNLETVFFMGMEPTIDQALPALARKLHRTFGTRQVLLTNGLYLPPLEHIDEIIFSIKAISEQLHREYTGRANIKALHNFRNIYQAGKKLQVESVLIPGYIDKGEIERIAAFVSSVDPSIPYRIDAYLPVGDNPWRSPTLEEIQDTQEVARKYLSRVSFISGKEDLQFKVVRLY